LLKEAFQKCCELSRPQMAIACGGSGRVMLKEVEKILVA
jgi:hypothetical protein